MFKKREGMMQVVKTTNGYISGTVIGRLGKEVSIFRGIPYAAPPVGKLRWKPPQPVKNWKGIRECTSFTAMSPQTFIPKITPDLPMSEDCLYLNVVTPAREPGEKLPVMVWMHGGGYASGCGCDKVWNNYRLPEYGVVVVTLTHRLGPIGLLAHPSLSKESSRGVSGNYLFLDLIASLQWIQDNISAFGGNPDNITIFGESGGGAKVTIMMASPLAKGLFHKAICESGTSTVLLTGKTMAESEKSGQILFKKLGVKTLEQARTLPAPIIIEAAQDMQGVRDPSQPPKVNDLDASADGWVLPDIPHEVFTSGSFNAVPLIVSTNLGELTGPGPLIISVLPKAYTEMLESNGRLGQKGYACVFDRVPAGWKKEGCVSVHSMELPYVFGDWDDSTGWWDSVSVHALRSGAKSEKPGLDATDREVSEAMMALWTSFARTGKPKAQGIPNWPEYNSKTDRYLYLSGKSGIRAGFSKLPNS
jgi:para-nitrobenzyl esterase